MSAYLQLYDPRNGDLSLRVEDFTTPSETDIQRTNYFTVFWVQDGSGLFCAQSGEFAFHPSSLLFLVPYQSYKFLCSTALRGLRLQFHANFLCIETYHEEVGCNGVLFNDTYGAPCVSLEDRQAQETTLLLDEIRRELQEAGLAHSEVLLSYLKIFLIRATRLKLQQQNIDCSPLKAKSPVVMDLTRLIESHFRTRHAPAEYAELLRMQPKSLARLVKLHFNKTLTNLIQERIVKQAKWELLHTRKPVKEIAMDLGFEDIFYFSRLFKRTTGCSPTFFRDFETAIRGGRNLSMS